MPEPKQTIHIRIRDLRRERALTQEELAEALGLSRQSINAMEAGRCLPSLPVALQIANFFSVPIGTVFGIAQELANEAANPSALIPWSPMRDLQESLSDLMDERVRWMPAPTPIVPTVNILQTADSLMIEFCLPGFRKEEIAIEVGDDFLTIAGRPTMDDNRSYLRREFMLQDFQRTLALPVPVRGEKAEAEMKDGILLIVVPRIIDQRPKSARVIIK